MSEPLRCSGVCKCNCKNIPGVYESHRSPKPNAMTGKSRKPRVLQDLLEEYLDKHPDQKKVQRGKVLTIWSEVVGAHIANVSENIHFERDTLVVEVSHSAWRHELHMNRDTIVRKLNQRVGGDVVKSLVVRA